MNALSARLPSNRDENWKYANLRGLARARIEPSAPPTADLQAKVAQVLPPALPGYPRLVLVDGYPIEGLSAPIAGVSVVPGISAAPGVAVVPAATAAPGIIAASGTGTSPDPAIDRYFVDLNRRTRASTSVIDVAAGTSLALELICVATGSGHPAVELRVGEGAQLSFIERQLGLRGEAPVFVNMHLAVALARHARLLAARIGHHDPKMQFVETLEARLGDSAEAKFIQLVEGGAASRSTAFVELAGRDAALEWHVAALGEGTQCHDAYARITHAAPGARTRQSFRGIATERSRIAFNGHMRVDSGAVGARTDQSLKCLLAGTEAEADARPQLEIHTDAVQASHGATVGKLDPDMLFYLLSRGIPPAAAESLLKWAFISDVLAHLPSPALRTQIEAALERQLPGAAASRVSQ